MPPIPRSSSSSPTSSSNTKYVIESTWQIPMDGQRKPSHR